MEGVIYRHTVEAFVERVVLRRGLLSLEFDRELKAIGVDPSRPKEVSLEVWLSLLRAAAKRLSPEKPLEDGLEDVGREMVRGYQDGLVGRGLFILLRLLGPRRALLRVKENFATADSVTSVNVLELSPTCIQFEFVSQFTTVPTYARGILLEALAQLKVRDPKVKMEVKDSGETVFTAWWG